MSLLEQKMSVGSQDIYFVVEEVPGNVPPRVPEIFCKVPWFALEGSSVSCAHRLKSHRIKIALLMGGTLSKTETNGF